MPRTDAVDGFRLAYDDHPGEAGPVVLLHGWPGDRHDWRDVVPLLAGRCRVVVPDLRGFGESESSPGAKATAFGGDGLARSVLALVEQFAAGPAVLAGYDVGSRTAAELDRLADAYARPGAFTASINWYRAGAGTVAMAVQEKAPASDDRIAAPTTVLWPEHDPLFPREWSDRVDDWFSDAQVRHLDGVGHFTPLEAPEAFAAAVLERVGA